MISCKELEENASRYLDGNLSFRRRLSIKLHLFICKNCRRYIRQLYSVICALKKSSPSSTISAEKAETIFHKCKHNSE